MFCGNCGKELENGEDFCTNCGSKTDISSQSTQEPIKEQYNQNQYNQGMNQPQYNQNMNQHYQQPAYPEVIDNPSHLAGAASCCFPIVGIILYFIWKDDKPQSAKLVCNWMIAGIVIWILFYIVCLAIGIAGAASSSSPYYYY